MLIKKKLKYRKPTKSPRTIQKERKLAEEKYIEKFKDIIKKASTEDYKKTEFKIIEDGLANFFNEVNLETNKIHIIRGNNGQGKSTLLENIVNATFLGALDSFSEKFKISSTSKKIANLLNYGMSYSPYKLDDNGDIFRSNLKYGLSSFNNSITLYMDFSISFFRESSGSIFDDISDEYNKNSNGERKIKGINEILKHLKLILSISEEELDKGLNLLIVMDEPESGLSLEIQEEFEKKLRRYLNKAIKNDKVSLTFLISSHSYVWKESEQVLIHNINDFKKDSEVKKEHSKVFI